MLQNAYFLGKIGADTAENERNLPKFRQKLATTRPGPHAGPSRPGRRAAVRRLRDGDRAHVGG